MAKPCLREGIAAHVLEFVILTAPPPGEVRGALWSETDMYTKAPTAPAGSMVPRKEHRFPPSDRAVALPKALPRIDRADIVTHAPNGKTICDMTLTAVIRRMNGAAESLRWIDVKSGKWVGRRLRLAQFAAGLGSGAQRLTTRVGESGACARDRKQGREGHTAAPSGLKSAAA